jgi:cytochrome c
MRRFTVTIAIPLLLAGGGLATACSDDEPYLEPVAEPAPALPADTVQAQVARGQQLFGQNCAKCHGANGEGTNLAPRIVGLDQGALPLNPPPGARLRTNQFHTAADIASFVTVNMPLDRPGSLARDDYFAILAYDLQANGVTLQAPLDAATAQGIVIHP